MGDEMGKAERKKKTGDTPGKTARSKEDLPLTKELYSPEKGASAAGPGPEGLSGEIALPEGFVSRMKSLMAEDEYELFLSSYGQERLFSLRINSLKTDRESFEKLFKESVEESFKESIEESLKKSCEGSFKESIEESFKESCEESFKKSPDLVRVPWEQDGFYYPEKWRPGRLPWHEAGMYYIQEASAMAPAVLCGVQPGERVLDLCAAPGGKTTKLAASLRGCGILVANEIHPDRARILSANIERMGVRNAVVTNETPQRLASRFPVFFDRIVVDAPCSGEGMFRKEEEALRQWSPENVTLCAVRQKEILEEAAAMLRPGGILVYSTCTFSPEENEQVIFHFLLDHPEFSAVSIGDLPGVDMGKWGFEPGRVKWIVSDPAASFSEGSDLKTDAMPESDLNPEGTAAHARAVSCASSVMATVRLWPHRLRGEGHFAAVLKKESLKPVFRDSSRLGSEERPAEEKTAEGRPAEGRPAEEKTAQGIIAEGIIAEGRPAEERIAEKRPAEEHSAEKAAEAGTAGSVKTDRHIKTGRKRFGKKEKNAGACGRAGGSRDGDAQAKRREALKLWKEFCRDNLVPGDPGETEEDPHGKKVRCLCREENLILFGDALWALPDLITGSDLDGLRVLRPGLHLGTVVRGRFEPAHALAMALSREEAVRSVSLPGTSPQAYAWFRGESIPTGEISDICESPGSTGTNCDGGSPGEKIQDLKGWCLVSIDGCAAGWGKAGGNVIKNHYPKGLRKGSWYR